MTDLDQMLMELSRVQEETRKAIAYRDSATRLVLAAGANYSQVARALGLSRSATWQQYGPRGARNGRSDAADSAVG